MVCSLVSIYFDSPQLGIQKKKLYKTLDYRSRDKLKFDLLEKGLGIVSPPGFFCMMLQVKCFSSYILLTDQISLSDCLYFLSYWSKCVLQFFVNQVVMS